MSACQILNWGAGEEVKKGMVGDEEKVYIFFTIYEGIAVKLL